MAKKVNKSKQRKTEEKDKQDKPYDNGFKRLLTVCAQDFLDWLVTGATFSGRFSEEFQSVTIDADAMMEALQDGEVVVVHFEGQSGPDIIMPQRLLEYSVLAYRRYRCIVLTYAIYFKKGGARPQSPLIWRSRSGKEILRFHFEVIELADISYAEMLAKNLRGLLPLVPLAKDGARREVIELIIDRLCEKRDTITEEVLALTSLFASLAMSSEEDQKWLKWRFDMLKDMLRDTPMYQHILQEGLEEGRKEGLEEGLEEGRAIGLEEGMEKERQERLSSLQHKLLAFIELRFPSLDASVKKRVAAIDQPHVLENLVFQMILARNIGETELILLQAAQNQSESQ